MTALGTVIGRGLASARPTAGTPGALYFSTDTLKLERDNGTSWDSVSSNPMTTQDDLIVAGASGVPTRLAKGSDGQVLTVDPSTHHLVWATPASGFADPTTTKGDLIVHGATTTRLAVGSDGQVLMADSAQAAGVKWAAGGGGLYSGYVCIRDEKSNGSQGGTFTSGAWRTRDLNTEHADTGNNASVASNQITLAAGTYRCQIVCPAFAVQTNSARLYNVTDSATLLSGPTAFAPASTISLAWVIGRFTIAGSKTLEVQHQCQATGTTIGFGIDGYESVEIFTVAEFWKEA